MKLHTVLPLAAASIAGLALAANAATVISVSEVFGHNEKDNFSGNIVDTINGSGMNGNPNTGGPLAGDPSSWIATDNGYQSEWQAQDILGDGDEGEDVPTNGKIGWAIYDLGSATVGLEDFYLWNIREDEPRAVDQYNVYHATTPTVTPVHGPTNNSSIDYDFSSGGWTQIGGTSGMSWRNTDGQAANDVVALGGITARYLAVEILSNGVNGRTGDANRTGLAEVGITQIPEPSSLALLGLGGLALLRRRR